MMKLNLRVITMSKIVASLLVLVILSGCANESVTIKYYKLGSQESASGMNRSAKDMVSRPLILIEPIGLADFLRQPGLVIQKTNHQIQISNIHRWSEDLQRATSRIIRKNLEAALPDYRFENQSGQWKTKPQFRISIELEEFHIVNHQKHVKASGQFWFFDDKRNLLLKKHFTFVEPINKNGYEHAVSKLELSLRTLSKMIIKNLSEYH